MDIQKNYDIFDLVKFILSIFIVSLHAKIVPEILVPVIRTAVPIFFMISSYLLFSKKQKMTGIESGGGTLRRFISRNLKLYFFWGVVLLPFTVAYKIYSDLISGTELSTLQIIIHGIQSLLFSIFPASWYITALVIAVTVLYRIPKRYNKLMLAFSFLLYLVCCTSSNYYYLFKAESVVIQFDAVFTLATSLPPYISFLVAFIWVGIGKVCAERTIAMPPVARRIGIVVSTIMLYLEYFAIGFFSLSRENDCYIMLVPLCSFIFLELLSANHVKIRNANTFRKMSTIIYCLHVTVIRVCRGALKYILHFESNAMVFAVTIFVCLAGCWVLFQLERKKRFTWLKYSH